MTALDVSEPSPLQQAVVTASASQYLVFPLGDDTYGLNIDNIKEIIEYRELTDVPMVPEFIRGVLNLRGNVVPVIDLLARFGGEQADLSKKTCVVIVELRSEEGVFEMGMMVDAVNEVIDIPASDIGAAPSFGTKIRTDFIDGMGKVNDKFIVLLDINHVLSIDELSLLEGVNADINDSIKLSKEALQDEPDEKDGDDQQMDQDQDQKH